jgi:hypothetical protein
MRSSADGATNWSGEESMIQATPYKNYSTAAGFDFPDGDYSETVTDGAGNFYGLWAEAQYKIEDTAGTGDVYFAKF